MLPLYLPTLNFAACPSPGPGIRVFLMPVLLVKKIIHPALMRLFVGAEHTCPRNPEIYVSYPAFNARVPWNPQCMPLK